MMKAIFFQAILFLALTGFSQKITPLDTMTWHREYAEALQIAKDSGKPVLMVFSGSDWCKPCIMLREQIFVQPEFNEWAMKNMVCLSLDFPAQKKNKLPQVLQEQNDELAERFNPGGVFPLVVILDSHETILGTLGYLDTTPAEYIREIVKLINK